MYATAFDWLTATPFGTPVLPEVNSRYAVSLPATTGSRGSAIFASCPADMTQCEDESLGSGSQSGSGRISVSGVSRRGSNDSRVAAHSRPTTRVLQPDASSMTSVLSNGNLALSGT